MALIVKEDLRDELGLSLAETKYDDLLDTIAAAIVNLFCEKTGREWEEDEFTEHHNTIDGQSTILLRRRPIEEGSIQVWDDPSWVFGNSSLLTLDSDYTVDYENGIIYAAGYFSTGKRSIKITYTAGYDSSSFPASWKQILIRQGAVWFQDSDKKRWDLTGVSNPTGGSISRILTEDGFLPEFSELIKEVRDMRID
jgi:hypothetical protein